MVAGPFRALVVLCTGCWQYLLTSMKWIMYTSVGCFCTWTYFSNNWLDKLQLKISYIISRRFPGLATGRPCGVWSRGWTTCLLFGGPLFSLCKWQWVCKSYIVERKLYWFLYLCFYKTLFARYRFSQMIVFSNSFLTQVILLTSCHTCCVYREIQIDLTRHKLQ